VATLYDSKRFYLITNTVFKAGVIHLLTCCEQRFVQEMLCMCDIWEEWRKRGRNARL